MNMRAGYLGEVIEARYAELAEEVIAEVKAMGPECRQSGDDSGLEDVWEEFKSQVQGEESIFYHLYIDQIEGFCEVAVAKLSEFEFKMLWFATDAYEEWDDNDEPDPPYSASDIEKGLLGLIMDTAMDEPLKTATTKGSPENIWKT